jgi:hypothetical protein
MRAVSLVCLLALAPLSAEATTIAGAALGSQLAGGTVTVTRFGGSMNTATFVAVGTGAEAVAPGSAGFKLEVSPGDTASATWTLTNTDPSAILFNRIVGATIDLTLSAVSLFDDGSLPSTPVSGSGVTGVAHAGGVAITASSELAPWSDIANQGDMYLALSITFGAGFTALASSSWTDDTDVIAVPEPATALMLALGLAGLRRGRRG